MLALQTRTSPLRNVSNIINIGKQTYQFTRVNLLVSPHAVLPSRVSHALFAAIMNGKLCNEWGLGELNGESPGSLIDSRRYCATQRGHGFTIGTRSDGTFYPETETAGGNKSLSLSWGPIQVDLC